MSEPRRRAVSTKAFTNHPHTAGVLGECVPKRRPSLASPLPPSSNFPFTLLNPSANHQRTLQQRPSITTSTSSSNLSDPPSSRGLMKRLLAKPAPPLSPSAPSPSMTPAFHNLNANEDDHEGHITSPEDQGLSTDPPLTPSSTNEFDKSIRALDLVGQIDISMTPFTTAGLDSITEPPESTNKQRNIFRRTRSGTTLTKPPVTTLLTSDYPIGFRSTDDDSASATATPTPPNTPPLHFPRRSSSSSPTRRPTSKKSLARSGSNLRRPKATHSHPTNSNKAEQSQTPYYSILGENSTIVGTGASGDSFWDASGEYTRGEQPREDGGAGLTRTPSREWAKNDSDRQIRSKSRVHDFARSSVDQDMGMAKKSPDGPAGSSPSRNFWKLVKKFSVSGLREKHQADSDHLAPVPSLPSHLTNDPFLSPIDSSFLDNVVSLSALPSSPTTLVDNSPSVPPSPPSASAQHRTKLSHSVPHSPPSQADSDHLAPVPLLSSYLTNDTFLTPVDSSLLSNAVSSLSSSSLTTLVDNFPSVPPSPPSASAQHRTKLSHSSPHSPPSQPTTGPRPSTTTRSSSPCSDVASSRFFNRQSARSSTSSLGEEATPLPPLPESSISTATSMMKGKMNANDINANLEIQQHVTPPRKLSQNLSTSHLPGTSLVPIIYPPPSMDDDWTIVRTPSVELEAVAPSPPRQLLKGIGTVKAKASDVIPKMLKMVNISSENVDEKSRDVSNDAYSQDNEENVIKEISTSGQGDKENDVTVPDTDRDSIRSQSPTIPSFSTSSAINSFPARKVSSSPSARSKGSPISLSSDRSDRNNIGNVFPTENGHQSPSRTPQRPGSDNAFGRVRHHLFGTSDVRVKAEEGQEIDKDLNPLLSSRKSDFHLGRLYSTSSSSKTSITTKTRPTHTASSSVQSMPASPTITRHRRSMSFNTSSTALPTRGLFTSLNPFSDPSQSSSVDSTPHITSLPPPPVGPSLTSSLGHRTRTTSNLRSGFPSRKFSEILSSSSSATRAPPSASSSHRTIGSLMSRSLSISGSNRSKSNIPNPAYPAISAQPHTQLTDQEKTDKWNDLLARSARAGGTLHLAAGSRLLGSDESLNDDHSTRSQQNGSE